ncbi:uncharacterized protein MKZ38_007911 [Zalerion maritima]|uniref:Uncharacterized protein n=1 Tax=Zalerion maritima TaxID=339359 RepID=A0AAD5WMR4_9PEZI|nr:uncharacterized protein MKZ38_007911 [Zalerion maritima]
MSGNQLTFSSMDAVSSCRSLIHRHWGKLSTDDRLCVHGIYQILHNLDSALLSDGYAEHVLLPQSASSASPQPSHAEILAGLGECLLALDRSLQGTSQTTLLGNPHLARLRYLGFMAQHLCRCFHSLGTGKIGSGQNEPTFDLPRVIGDWRGRLSIFLDRFFRCAHPLLRPEAPTPQDLDGVPRSQFRRAQAILLELQSQVDAVEEAYEDGAKTEVWKCRHTFYWLMAIKDHSSSSSNERHPEASKNTLGEATQCELPPFLLGSVVKAAWICVNISLPVEQTELSFIQLHLLQVRLYSENLSKLVHVPRSVNLSDQETMQNVQHILSGQSERVDYRLLSPEMWKISIPSGTVTSCPVAEPSISAIQADISTPSKLPSSPKNQVSSKPATDILSRCSVENPSLAPTTHNFTSFSPVPSAPGSGSDLGLTGNGTETTSRRPYSFVVANSSTITHPRITAPLWLYPTPEQSHPYSPQDTILPELPGDVPSSIMPQDPQVPMHLSPQPPPIQANFLPHHGGGRQDGEEQGPEEQDGLEEKDDDSIQIPSTEPLVNELELFNFEDATEEYPRGRGFRRRSEVRVFKDLSSTNGEDHELRIWTRREGCAEPEQISIHPRQSNIVARVSQTGGPPLIEIREGNEKKPLMFQFPASPAVRANSNNAAAEPIKTFFGFYSLLIGCFYEGDVIARKIILKRQRHKRSFALSLFRHPSYHSHSRSHSPHHHGRARDPENKDQDDIRGSFCRVEAWQEATSMFDLNSSQQRSRPSWAVGYSPSHSPLAATSLDYHQKLQQQQQQQINDPAPTLFREHPLLPFKYFFYVGCSIYVLIVSEKFQLETTRLFKGLCSLKITPRKKKEGVKSLRLAVIKGCNSDTFPAAVPMEHKGLRIDDQNTTAEAGGLFRDFESIEIMFDDEKKQKALNEMLQEHMAEWQEQLRPLREFEMAERRRTIVTNASSEVTAVSPPQSMISSTRSGPREM